MKSLTVKSFAKLNLFLQVLNKRKDGYHNLNTVFERISLYDTIILKTRRDNKIIISCNSRQVPLDSSNIAYKSAKLLQEKFHLSQGVNIKIIKRIPVGSGMGGGSSNAAAALIALNKFWKLKLSNERLAKLAANIGSDVPFFIYESRFAQGSGRGDKIKPLPKLQDLCLWHILVVPKVFVSTRLIYAKLDSLNSQLTMPKYDDKILISRLATGDYNTINPVLFNNLEQVSLRLYPQIAAAKRKLKNLGVENPLMSGSGAAVFGIVGSRKQALSLRRQLKINRSWKVLVAKSA